MRNPELKREEDGFFPEFERQKLQGFYTQGGAAYGSVRNLVKASNLPVSKVRQFLHSKLSYTTFSIAIQKIKKLKAFVILEKEI